MSGRVLVLASVLVLSLCGTAVAQVPLTVNEGGTVFQRGKIVNGSMTSPTSTGYATGYISFFGWVGGSCGSFGSATTFTTTTSPPTSPPTSTTHSPTSTDHPPTNGEYALYASFSPMNLTWQTVTSGYIADLVVEFYLSPSQPLPKTAVLSFYTATTTTVPPTIFPTTWTLWWQTAPNGSLSTGDFITPGATSWPGAVRIGQASSPVFDVTPYLKQDINDGQSFSTFVLTRQGPGRTVFLGAPVMYSMVPEPGTLALLGFGLVTLMAGHRIRRRRAA